MLLVKFKNGTFKEVKNEDAIINLDLGEIDVVYKISQELIPVVKLTLIPKDKYYQNKSKKSNEINDNQELTNPVLLKEENKGEKSSRKSRKEKV